MFFNWALPCTYLTVIHHNCQSLWYWTHLVAPFYFTWEAHFDRSVGGATWLYIKSTHSRSEESMNYAAGMLALMCTMNSKPRPADWYACGRSAHPNFVSISIPRSELLHIRSMRCLLLSPPSDIPPCHKNSPVFLISWLWSNNNTQFKEITHCFRA